jgi:predicted acyltransferase
MEKEIQHSAPSGRIISIDALRGFDMFWITGGAGIFAGLHKIFDNKLTASICEQFEHVKWDGFRFEDLIFPLFLFIVGAVFPFALTKRIERGQNKLGITGHIIRRGLTLILIGMILQGLLSFDFENMRWVGVLQRIGACYLIGALIVVYTNNWKTQAGITAAILILYWAAHALIPVPEFGAGVITMEGCLSSYIDQLLLPGKLYYVYGDNEGLLSTLPATATVLIGVLAGHWLRSDKPGTKKAIGLAGAGVICLVIGYTWGIVFPIVKLIWTSSFVMVTAGYSLLLLSVFYYIIDVLKFRKWAFFFVVIGMNAITIFILVRFIRFGYISELFLSGLAKMAGSGDVLIIAIGAIFAKWLLLYWFYRRRIFFKV